MLINFSDTEVPDPIVSLISDRTDPMILCYLGAAMAKMETGTVVRPSDIQKVMERFNIYPVGYGHI